MEIFVYGTLKRGHSNNRFLENANYVGDFHTEPKYHLVDMGYFPAIIEGGKGKIHGEVWKINDKILKNLDYLESEGLLYDRKIINVKDNSSYKKVFAYILNDKHREYDFLSEGDLHWDGKINKKIVGK